MLLNCDAGEYSWESLGLQGGQTSQSSRKIVQNIHWRDWYWSWNSNILANLTWRADSFEKTLMLGKIEGRQEKGTTEDEMVEWLHQLNRLEFEQAPGVGDGQGSLACCSPWDRKESDKTEWLNWTELAQMDPRVSNLRSSRAFVFPSYPFSYSYSCYDFPFNLWLLLLYVCSVMFDSLRPHGLWPTKLLCLWNFPGKNTGVVCHFFLQGIFLNRESNPCFLHHLNW